MKERKIRTMESIVLADIQHFRTGTIRKYCERHYCNGGSILPVLLKEANGVKRTSTVQKRLITVT
jgi:hypothetical protein